MKQYFHGAGKEGPYFEGWYFKCRTGAGRTVALIPAYHIDRENRPSASLQVISEAGTWWAEYPQGAFSAASGSLRVQVGANTFSENGLSLDIQQPGCSLRGKLDFGPFLPLRTDIMGPFRFFPNMECAHGVLSMAHTLQGRLTLNGETLDFDGGTGYIETDRGRGFPRAYLWAQGAFPEGSFMLSVAEIPILGIRFTGCICAVMHRGQEYRLATYRGAGVARWSENGAVIRQGRYRLEVEALDRQPQPLRAPTGGAMERTIHESLQGNLRCRLWRGDTCLLDRTDPGGSFEYAGGEHSRENTPGADRRPAAGLPEADGEG